MTAAIAQQRHRSPAPTTPSRAARPSASAMRPGPSRQAGPLCAADRVAAFEIVMMMRCTAPIVARRRASAPRTGYGLTPNAGGVLNEFGQAQPAYRLARLLAGLDIEARVDRRFEGGRHRYEVYRVIVSPGAGDLLRGILDEAWRSGCLLICRAAGRALPRWQQRDRRALAVAAWRAALMAAGRRRSASLALRLADPDTTSVLVNAARAVAVQTRTQTRPGYHLVSVSPDFHYEQLLAVASGTEALEDAV